MTNLLTFYTLPIIFTSIRQLFITSIKLLTIILIFFTSPNVTHIRFILRTQGGLNRTEAFQDPTRAIFTSFHSVSTGSDGWTHELVDDTPAGGTGEALAGAFCGGVGVGGVVVLLERRFAHADGLDALAVCALDGFFDGTSGSVTLVLSRVYAVAIGALLGFV
jgi:hypothetical protein